MHFMHVKQTASLHDTATYKIKRFVFSSQNDGLVDDHNNCW